VVSCISERIVIDYNICILIVFNLTTCEICIVKYNLDVFFVILDEINTCCKTDFAFTIFIFLEFYEVFVTFFDSCNNFFFSIAFDNSGEVIRVDTACNYIQFAFIDKRTEIIKHIVTCVIAEIIVYIREIIDIGINKGKTGFEIVFPDDFFSFLLECITIKKTCNMICCRKSVDNLFVFSVIDNPLFFLVDIFNSAVNM